MQVTLLLLSLIACISLGANIQNDDNQVGQTPTTEAVVNPSHAGRIVSVRAPTRDEAEKAAGICGVRVKYWDGIGRPPPEAVYQPIDATAAQSECYFSRVRQLVAKPEADAAE